MAGECLSQSFLHFEFLYSRASNRSLAPVIVLGVTTSSVARSVGWSVGWSVGQSIHKNLVPTVFARNLAWRSSLFVCVCVFVFMAICSKVGVEIHTGTHIHRHFHFPLYFTFCEIVCVCECIHACYCRFPLVLLLTTLEPITAIVVALAAVHLCL